MAHQVLGSRGAWSRGTWRRHLEIIASSRREHPHDECNRALRRCEALRREVGALGNACVHLTDDQSAAVATWQRGGGDSGGGGGGGYECDSSYAYHCARVLLDESSVAWLNAADATSPVYEARFQGYAEWLSNPFDSSIGGAPGWKPCDEAT
jgi:hypothetical protein